MRCRWIIPLFLLLPFLGQGQLYLGGNAGSLLGRTADAYALLHPKNQDWLAFSFSGGYTVPGPLFLPHKYDSIERYRHGGYHIRLGARNFITSDHLSNHLFWGGHVNYAGVTEKGNSTAAGGGEVKKKFGSLGVQFDAGYSICLNPHAMRDKWKLDLGLQLGFPLTNTSEFMAAIKSSEDAKPSAGYVPGLGYGRAGEEAYNLQLIVLLRYMMWDGRYGHFRPRKTKHNRKPKVPKPFKVVKQKKGKSKDTDDGGGDGKGEKSKKEKKNKNGSGDDPEPEKAEKAPKEKKKKKKDKDKQDNP